MIFIIQEKEQRIGYNEEELKTEIIKIKQDVITNVGEGDFHISYYWRSTHWLVVLYLDVNKNSDDYNSKFINYVEILHGNYKQTKQTNISVFGYWYKKLNDDIIYEEKNLTCM